MKHVELEKKLIAVARANPPSDHVPAGFSRRVMARIAARPVDLWAAWARGLWVAAAPCVAVMIMFSAWAFFHAPQPQHTQTASIDLAQQLDNTLLAAVDQNNQTTDSGW